MSQLVLHTQFQNTIIKWKILEMGLKYLANTQLFKLFLFSRFFLRDWPKGLDLMCSLKHTQTIFF